MSCVALVGLLCSALLSEEEIGFGKGTGIGAGTGIGIGAGMGGFVW